MDQLATIYSFWASQRYFQAFKHNRRAFFEDHLLFQSTLLMVAFKYLPMILILITCFKVSTKIDPEDTGSSWESFKFIADKHHEYLHLILTFSSAPSLLDLKK